MVSTTHWKGVERKKSSCNREENRRGNLPVLKIYLSQRKKRKATEGTQLHRGEKITSQKKHCA